MPASDFVPGPRDLVTTSLSLDGESLRWLDEIADRTGRSRSDTLREILRNVRQAEAAARGTL